MRGLWMLGVLVGCAAPPPTGQELQDALSDRGGCADLYTYAASADGTLLLDVRVDGLIAAAQSAGEPQTTTFTAPDPLATITLVQGTRVDDAACDDVLENGGPQVRRTWSATAGQLEIVAEPAFDGNDDARADVSLTDVELTEIGGSSVLELPGINWENVSVGWFAG